MGFARLSVLVLAILLGGGRDAPDTARSLRWAALSPWRHYATPGDREGVIGVETASASVVADGSPIQFVRIRKDDVTLVLVLPCAGQLALDEWTKSYTELRRCVGPSVDVADRYMSFQRDMLARIDDRPIQDVSPFSNNGDWYEPAAAPDRLDALAPAFTAARGVVPHSLGPGVLGIAARTGDGQRIAVVFTATQTILQTAGKP